jgi:hypothetical protein
VRSEELRQSGVGMRVFVRVCIYICICVALESACLIPVAAWRGVAWRV